MRNAVDYSYARPSGDLLSSLQLDALGYTGNARPDQGYLDDLARWGVTWTFVQETYSGRALEGYPAGVYDAQFADNRADQRGHPRDRSIVYVVSDGSRFDPSSGGDAIADYGEAIARTSLRPFLAYGNAYALAAFERGVARVPGNRYIGGPWGIRTWDPPPHVCLVQEPNIASPIPDTDFNSVYRPYTGASAPTPAPQPIEEDDMYVRIVTAGDATIPWYVTWIHPAVGRRVKRQIDKVEADWWKAETAFVGVPAVFAPGGGPYTWSKASIDALPDPPPPSAGGGGTPGPPAPTHFVGTLDVHAA